MATNYLLTDIGYYFNGRCRFQLLWTLCSVMDCVDSRPSVGVSCFVECWQRWISSFLFLQCFDAFGWTTVITRFTSGGPDVTWSDSGKIWLIEQKLKVLLEHQSDRTG